ncbi:BadF/BadG/BcrA/BcrD ATPase family protein [Paenibacillus sp. LHD-117]|uniref:N-acetylglucosamine kinase n=1 Tax=Paenibacillus sp. LHD-117 TaxID=3071412 RepID=UPI0027DFAC0B|nr:BadF/BadG/BcrA/BcrD ATPase family protein [Paenibacillus sp. LHD-117]MDQ6418777.1 BadF/BadG/BcrA/BcrD ATPase family protein [Paenibacillus sp. LHD-117]
MGNYVIGVDGGNSKTDYYLFDLEGRRKDHIRSGTCSHEQFPEGYAKAYQVMNEQITELLARNGLTMEDVAAGAFGLAGADIPSQKEQLNAVIERIGFARFAMDNDSFLGIKAGSAKGYGICSINGSGVCTGGISPSGRRLQVGGVGSELAGDEGGGFYLTRRVLRAIYDGFYRLGPETSMTPRVMELIGAAGKETFMDRALEGMVARSLPYTAIVTTLLEAAEQGDPVASGIVDHSARQLAYSTVGCMSHLDFDDGEPVDIVMAGSVWSKAASPVMRERYKLLVAELTGRECRFILLQEPPAAGAVLWALELALGGPVGAELRAKVIDAVS